MMTSTYTCCTHLYARSCHVTSFEDVGVANASSKTARSRAASSLTSTLKRHQTYHTHTESQPLSMHCVYSCAATTTHRNNDRIIAFETPDNAVAAVASNDASLVLLVTKCNQYQYQYKRAYKRVSHSPPLTLTRRSATTNNQTLRAHSRHLTPATASLSVSVCNATRIYGQNQEKCAQIKCVPLSDRHTIANTSTELILMHDNVLDYTVNQKHSFTSRYLRYARASDPNSAETR
jgi:hypothetical protein